MLYIAALLCLVSAAAAQSTKPADMYILTRTWGPEECDAPPKFCSIEPVAQFTIHGLWPNYKSGGYPADCAPSNKFSSSSLPPALVNQMSCEWVSYRGSNAGFWGYEWGKHGTCAVGNLKSQPSYFNATIALHNAYEPNEALVAAGIDPAKAQDYPPSKLLDAFQAKWGVRPVFSCNEQDFYEVWICFDLNLKPFTCPSNVKARPCPSSIGFVPGDSNVPAICSKYYEPASTGSSGGSAATGGSPPMKVNGTMPGAPPGVPTGVAAPSSSAARSGVSGVMAGVAGVAALLVLV